MSIPALLQFIFAPVLGPLFAPLLIAPVRVRVVAVLSALIVAASLSVSAPAEALTRWHPICETDEWDDTPSCHVYGIPVESGFSGNTFPVIAYGCKGAGEQNLYLVVQSELLYPFGGFERTSGEWESGESFTLHKVQIRWDKEPASEGIILQEGGEYTWWWRQNGPDWWGWEGLNMTPTTFPNPIRLLQEKNRLRIRYLHPRHNEPQVITYPLADAREHIAEAKRHCGL